MQPIIEIDSIVTKFGTKTVHNGVSFSIERGKVVAIIGSSGSGKSTLLREIIGLLRPTSGRILVDGTDVWAASDLEIDAMRNRWGVMFQQGALFSALTVRDNIAAPLQEQSDLPEELLDEIIALRLQLAGLEPSVAKLMPSELSGGMVKRVALARALALEPDVLFLDEPTSGLDPINARRFDRLVQTLSRGLGLSVVMVTHDLDSILSIVDQLVVLDGGKVIGDGPVEEVSQLDHPWIQDYFSSRAEQVA